MTTLEDAWAWFNQNRTLLKLMSRLGDKYWSDLPWEGALGRDDHFRTLEGDQVKAIADAVLSEFDELAVFVIFSVFESIVRRRVADDLRSEVSGLEHPALQKSARSMLRNIEEGSFSNNVLDLFKKDGREPGSLSVNSLVEEVSRVRRYRNWVAHGRKVEGKPNMIVPKDAYDILQAFLTYIDGLPDASR